MSVSMSFPACSGAFILRGAAHGIDPKSLFLMRDKEDRPCALMNAILLFATRLPFILFVPGLSVIRGSRASAWLMRFSHNCTLPKSSTHLRAQMAWKIMHKLVRDDYLAKVDNILVPAPRTRQAFGQTDLPKQDDEKARVNLEMLTSQFPGV